jgi:urea transport system permease protein
VDAFLVVVFGGMSKLVGTIVSAFGVAQGQSIAQFFMDGAMGKVIILAVVVIILMIRPQGLFPSKVRA